MGDLRARLLQACHLPPGGVTGVTGVTGGPVTSENPSSYNGYACYASDAPDLRARSGCHEDGVTDGLTGVEGRHWGADEWTAFVEKRITIREREGRLSRCEAERLAIEAVITLWLSLLPARPSDGGDGCVRSGSGDPAWKALLALLAPGGLVWVHDRCWQHWQKSRRDEARLALRGSRAPAPRALSA